MSEGADLERAIAHYRDLAPRYDHATRFIDRIRLRTIAALGLREGEAVLDAGCGTGWCLPHLARAVGPSGRVIGFDPSPEMLAIARARRLAPEAGALELVESTAAAFVSPRPVEAILFSYTHDLLQSRDSVARVLAQARPGARVAATSTKLYAPWLAPANWYLRYTHREYITDFRSFDAPWALLAGELDDFRVETGPLTQHYVATGRVREPALQRA